MIEIEIPKIKRTKLYLFGEKENKEREKQRKKKRLLGTNNHTYTDTCLTKRKRT
jgi:hypothetical protein